MLSLDEYLREAEVAHGHLCAGQVLGVRMAMLGLEKLGLEDPRGNKQDRKRLVTFVEIDRCATDAIAVVTGCRLGKRALKFRDWGKMAATFVDLSICHPEGARGSAATARESKDPYPLHIADSGHCYKAIRIAAKESSKQSWRAKCIPKLKTRNSSRCRPIAKCPKTTYSPSSG